MFIVHIWNNGEDDTREMRHNIVLYLALQMF
jgi:hypothetical protein